MQKGFTLVELSIVLVIIGLLIGGLLVGQSLIESAKINKIGRTVSQYNIMLNLYNERFKCAPGDCNRSFVPTTLRGDGNGIIEKWEGTSSLGALKAGGFYPTTADLNGCNYFAGGDRSDKNCYLRESSIKKSIYWPGGVRACDGTGCDFGLGPYLTDTGTIDGQNYIMLGSDNYLLTSASQDYLPYGLFTPTFAKAIDAKFDDGLPNTGKVLATGGVGPTYYQCATGLTSVDTYSGTDEGCIMFFYSSLMGNFSGAF